ncbi:H/ACA ribonucleoprotein complex subunit GAR1 [Natronobeatus ordinarius]|uniref:H/ACA ribonucleoprotein complex subunit GAR1 n=1 Tax=Natronobeatus ordinarius TaxID=2963433 RepID=UPI0020CE03C7|nr:Gar1/Naf1 family protein [Natronobeatus ordinarius]
MYRVGQVVRVAQGLAILRAAGDDPASIGTMVLDDSLAEVGRVVDVFGPVERPYLAVTPNDDVHLPALVGETLYAR